jgi:hypothetical protein
MTFDQKFGGVIWTNHALARLSERGIKQGDAWATLKNPDQSRFASTKNAWVYYKTYGNQRIEVVAKQNERKEWVVLSVWSKPVYDFPQRQKVEPLWKLIFRKLFKKNE